MLSPRVPNLVPIPGPRKERETPSSAPTTELWASTRERRWGAAAKIVRGFGAGLDADEPMTEQDAAEELPPPDSGRVHTG